jgi:hypothetical protein
MISYGSIFFRKIESSEDIAHCNKLGNILLCGDFNARISCEHDFILSDESKFTPNYEDYKTDKNILECI